MRARQRERGECEREERDRETERGGYERVREGEREAWREEGRRANRD